MEWKRTISLIAWDLDNTLVERDEAFRGCLLSLGEAFPNPGLNASTLAPILEADQSGGADRWMVMALLADALGLERSEVPVLWERLQLRLPEFIQPDDRIAALLEELAEDFAFALVSNGGGVLQRAKLRRSGLQRFIPDARILISGELGIEKPDVGIFNELMRRTGIPADAILFVGDDIERDIMGARNAGMRTCWISRGRGLRCDADFVVSHVGELRQILGKQVK